MRYIKVSCFLCGKEFERLNGEVNRTLRRGLKIFCSSSCSAKFSNIPRCSKEIKAICPFCQKEFVTSTLRRAAKFCSRSCATKGSFSEEKLEAQRQAGVQHRNNLISVHESLKMREAWKYVAIRDVLQKENRKFEFEFPLDGFVFDLAIFDSKLLVEFDALDHQDERQKVTDSKKEEIAKKNGFMVLRRSVLPMTVIGPETISGL